MFENTLFTLYCVVLCCIVTDVKADNKLATLSLIINILFQIDSRYTKDVTPRTLP